MNQFWARYFEIGMQVKLLKKKLQRDVLRIYYTCIMSKGQLISKGHFDVFKSTKKTSDILVRIPAPASKKMLNHKDNGTLLY